MFSSILSQEQNKFYFILAWKVLKSYTITTISTHTHYSCLCVCMYVYMHMCVCVFMHVTQKSKGEYTMTGTVTGKS